MLQTFQNLARRKLQDFIGVTGTQIYSGVISGEDHNIEWQDDKAIENVRLMNSTDATVHGTLLSIKLPMMGAKAWIEPASEDNADIKIAEFVEANMFKNRMFNYSDWLRHALLYLDFGFEIMEKAYVLQDDNRLWWKFEHRKPETVREWHVDSDNDLDHILQEAVDPQTGRFDRVPIPAEKLFHIANDMEGHNFRGVSILRSAWRNYKIKDVLIRLNAIQSERFGVGIPKGEMKSGGNKDDLLAALKSLRANDEGYLLTTPEYSVDLLATSGKTGIDMMPAIEYHDRQINANILREFANPETKSFAKSYVEAGAFYMALDAVAKNIEDALNQGSGKMHNIKQLVDLNFPNVTAYPRFMIDRRRLQNAGEMAEALSKLSTVYPGLSGEEMEEYVREINGWPEKTEGEPTPEPKPVEPGPLDKDNPYQMQALLFCREPTDFEKRVCNLGEMDSKIRKVQADLLSAATEFRTKMVRDLSERAVKIALKSKDASELQKKIEATLIPHTGAMRQAITRESKELFDFGRQTVKDELQRQKVSAIKINDPIVEKVGDALKSISPTVKNAVSSFSSKIRDEWALAVLTMFKAGDVSTTFIRERMNRVSSNLFNKTIKQIANESFGLGRNSELVKQQKNFDHMVRSEILDEATCDPCIDVDGTEFTVNSPEFSQFSRGPYDLCNGSDQCRGINVAVV